MPTCSDQHYFFVREEIKVYAYTIFYKFCQMSPTVKCVMIEFTGNYTFDEYLKFRIGRGNLIFYMRLTTDFSIIELRVLTSDRLQILCMYNLTVFQ